MTLCLTLCPATILLFATPLKFCIPYQMLLTSIFQKHTYSYISQNNFGPSSQIIVPTGYNMINSHSMKRIIVMHTGISKRQQTCVHTVVVKCVIMKTQTQLTSLSAFISGNDMGSGPSPNPASNPSSTLTVTSWPEVAGQVSLGTLCAISGTGVPLCKQWYIYQKWLCPLVPWNLIIHLGFTLEHRQYLRPYST